jgi:hypothetical protein
MVQPSFSNPRRVVATDDTASPTAALDVFLDNQHQSYFEELYKSEAVCLCILRSAIQCKKWPYRADETAEDCCLRSADM